MGSSPAPSYANMFMSRIIDKKIAELAQKYSEKNENPIQLLKRFLDDIFSIFVGTTEKLHQLFKDINNIHPNIQFTMEHTTPNSIFTEQNPCQCERRRSIPYLDTLCTIKEGKIITSLYRKPSDKNQYLLTSSCHPASVTANIPFSLALRINRICSAPEDRETAYKELKDMLIQREYPDALIDGAIARSRAIPRGEALRRANRQLTTKRPTFVVTFDPRNPSVKGITQKHWRSMVNQDGYLKKVFPAPPLIAFKRQQNIRDKIIRAKVAPEQRNQRNLVGMKKCGNCVACIYIKEGKLIKTNIGQWKINKRVDCNTKNVIYLLECDKNKCNEKYVGETERNFKERVKEHLGYARNFKLNQPAGLHFNLPGHNIHNMKFTIIEKVQSNDPLYRRERERYHIEKFNTYHSGMNKKP